MEHKLKILPQYFKEVKEGIKTFEIRENDRDYKVEDTILLREIENKTHESPLGNFLISDYTGQEITKEVTYILEGGQYGLEEGYCILGLKEPLDNISNCARCGRTIVNFEECDCKVEYFQKGIELKNIDLTGISKDEQKKKVVEEMIEFENAYLDYEDKKTEENKIHVMEELLDEFQSKLGLLEKEGIKAEEVQAYYGTWVRKLENRPRIKLCSKCKLFSICLEFEDLKTYDEYAKECKIYEEQEE